VTVSQNFTKRNRAPNAVDRASSLVFLKTYPVLSIFAIVAVSAGGAFLQPSLRWDKGRSLPEVPATRRVEKINAGDYAGIRTIFTTQMDAGGSAGKIDERVLQRAEATDGKNP